MRGLKRDKVVKIARLSGCKNFVDKRERERSLYSMLSLRAKPFSHNQESREAKHD